MTETAEKQAGFWCAYEPPGTHVSELVQRPLYKIDGNALVIAYMRDWRKAQAEKKQ